MHAGPMPDFATTLRQLGPKEKWRPRSISITTRRRRSIPLFGTPCCRGVAIQFDNASSRHEYGRATRRAIDEARERVAAAVGAHATEIVFSAVVRKPTICSSRVLPHGSRPDCWPSAPSSIPVYAASNTEQLVRQGWQLCRLAVDAEGRVDEAAYRHLLVQKPKLISIMLANNETGVLQDVGALAANWMTREHFFIPMPCRPWARCRWIFAA